MTARMIMKLTVAERRELGDGVARFVFRHPKKPSLPAWSPGAHIDMRLPDGKVRQYSLISDPDDLSHYAIAVKREAPGRGGSSHIHANLSEGDETHISAPRNNFPLQEGPAVFIAGGIGVTPMISMAREAARRGSDLAFHLCVRSDASPFPDIVRESIGGESNDDSLTVYRSQGEDARRLEVARLVSTVSPDIPIYCCGPERLTDAVADAAATVAGRDEDSVHFEVFTTTLDENFNAEPFDVTVLSTGKTHRVPADRSALDILREAGHTLPSSCELGVCGSCECGYTEGAVIHRDKVLRPSARQTRMMLCVSRARVAVTVDI